MKPFLFILIAFALSQSAFALDYETLRISVWKKGETYYGHDLVAANEVVADYLVNLQRPAESNKSIKYDCQIKLLVRDLKVNFSPPTTDMAWATLLTVYDVKNCNPAH